MFQTTSRRTGAAFAIAIALTAPNAYAVGDGAAPALPDHITIASEGARPPYNYLNGDALEGFEIELGHDLCRRMKMRCAFVSETWDELIPGLLARRYDAIMAAMEINRMRQAQIAFSAPYVRLPSAFLVRKGSGIRSEAPDDLAGRPIGVEQGGPHLAYLRKVYPGAKIRKYATLSDAILDLEAGRVDAALGDKDAVVDFLENRRDAACCRILADVPRYPDFFGDGIGIGLRKEDAALKAAFDAAIASAVTDGTFARISARYFSFPINEPASGRVVEHRR